jgi:hypothetical protein
MRTFRVAIVGRDPATRQAAAEAFDDAPGSWDVSLHSERPSGFDAVVLLPDAMEGDGIRFDPDRPRRIVEELTMALDEGDGPVGVWAPCPGAGATSVAVHLAAALAETEDCYLADMDPLRGAARRLGCPPFEGDARMKARPVSGGFRLIEGELPRIEGEAGRVIVDGPGQAVLTAGCSKHVIVVPSGRVGLERAREVLSDLGSTSSAIIVNRTGWGGELSRTAIHRLLGHRIALELPPSPALRDAEDRSELLTSFLSPWLNRIRRLARAL